jgi:hypothetical protein
MEKPVLTERIAAVVTAATLTLNPAVMETAVTALNAKAAWMEAVRFAAATQIRNAAAASVLLSASLKTAKNAIVPHINVRCATATPTRPVVMAIAAIVSIAKAAWMENVRFAMATQTLPATTAIAVAHRTDVALVVMVI